MPTRHRHSAWKGFAGPIVAAIVVGIVFFLVQKLSGSEATLLAFGNSVSSGLLALVVWWFWSEFRDMHKEAENSFENVRGESLFASLISRHLATAWPLKTVLRELVDTYSREEGAAIVVSAEGQQYLKWLTEALGNGQGVFEAILRGGDSYRYRPRWFFQQGDDAPSTAPLLRDASGHVKMESWKRGYLERVAKARLATKKRILIFPKRVICEDFADAELRSAFIEIAGKNTQQFWLPEEELLTACKSNAPFDARWKRYYRHDFAIIDSLVLMHASGDAIRGNGSKLLFFSIADQIKPYRELFDQLNEFLRHGSCSHPITFHRLTKKKIGDQTWDAWTRANCSSVPAEAATPTR